LAGVVDEETGDVSDFDAALARCGLLDEDVLGRPWQWRGRQIDVRYALYRTLEEAQEVHVRVSAGAHPESRRILALAEKMNVRFRHLRLKHRPLGSVAGNHQVKFPLQG